MPPPMASGVSRAAVTPLHDSFSAALICSSFEFSIF